ncbi:MAG TPA: hypothetical protein PKN71_01230 [Bacillota bacterium]|nr:hypothetical protein [Bacillota bacterium]HPZ21968.1 hypothetical protein [Bacillota bacterium]HQD19679.1 hypothetical protein [Bacillota bacterium]
MKKAASIILCLALILLLSGCAGDSPQKPDSEYQDYTLEIIGLDEEVSITLAAIYAMDSSEVKFSNISSSGEESSLNIKGVWLDDILAPYGAKQTDYNGIRFFARDGYSIIVPKELLAKSKIMLFYEAEGAPLKEKHRPIRAAIDGERSMYWVGNLQGFELISEEIASILEVVLLDAAFTQLPQEDIAYYDAKYKGIKTADLIATFSPGDTVEHVFLKSVDGLEKRELSSIFLAGNLLIEGEEQPLFMSPDLPKGMYVKDLLYFTYRETAFISLDRLVRKYPDEIIAGEITLSTICDALALPESSSYQFRNIAGEEVQAPPGAAIRPEKGGYTLIAGDVRLENVISFSVAGP